MIGWLLDTNVVAALVNPNGAPSVKRWAAEQREETFFLSILTLAEYDKGIANLADDHPDRWRYAAALDALEARFSGRVLSLDDRCVRLWGKTAGEAKRRTGAAPPVIDTLLAATAVVHRLYLVTRNGRDMRESGAVVFNPWDDDAAAFPLLSRREDRLAPYRLRSRPVIRRPSRMLRARRPRLAAPAASSSVWTV